MNFRERLVRTLAHEMAEEGNAEGGAYEHEGEWFIDVRAHQLPLSRLVYVALASVQLPTDVMQAAGATEVDYGNPHPEDVSGNVWVAMIKAAMKEFTEVEMDYWSKLKYVQQRTVAQQALLDLAARCEAATGLDHALDDAIVVATQIGCRDDLPDDLEYLTEIRPDDNVTAGAHWFHCRSGKSLRASPKFTASTDAALLLLPDGHGCRLWMPNRTRTVHPQVTIWGDGDSFAHYETSASTPALAICAAALRARAALTET